MASDTGLQQNRRCSEHIYEPVIPPDSRTAPTPTTTVSSLGPSPSPPPLTTTAPTSELEDSVDAEVAAAQDHNASPELDDGEGATSPGWVHVEDTSDASDAIHRRLELNQQHLPQRFLLVGAEGSSASPLILDEGGGTATGGDTSTAPSTRALDADVDPGQTTRPPSSPSCYLPEDDDAPSTSQRPESDQSPRAYQRSPTNRKKMQVAQDCLRHLGSQARNQAGKLKTKLDTWTKEKAKKKKTPGGGGEGGGWTLPSFNLPTLKKKRKRSAYKQPQPSSGSSSLRSSARKMFERKGYVTSSPKSSLKLHRPADDDDHAMKQHLAMHTTPSPLQGDEEDDRRGEMYPHEEYLGQAGGADMETTEPESEPILPPRRLKMLRSSRQQEPRTLQVHRDQELLFADEMSSDMGMDHRGETAPEDEEDEEAALRGDMADEYGEERIPGPGVLEEIDSDEFFLRAKGISQEVDNPQLELELQKELREAYMRAVADNPLEALGGGSGTSPPPLAPSRYKRRQKKQLRRSPPGGGPSPTTFATYPPKRPTRGHGRPKVPMVMLVAATQQRSQDGEDGDKEDGTPQMGTWPLPPKRTKKQRRVGKEELDEVNTGTWPALPQRRKKSLEPEEEEEDDELEGMERDDEKAQLRAMVDELLRAEIQREIEEQAAAEREAERAAEKRAEQEESWLQDVENQVISDRDDDVGQHVLTRFALSHDLRYLEQEDQMQQQQQPVASSSEETPMEDVPLDDAPVKTPRRRRKEIATQKALGTLVEDDEGYATIRKEEVEVDEERILARSTPPAPHAPNQAYFFTMPPRMPRTYRITPPSRPTRTYSTLRPSRPKRRRGRRGSLPRRSPPPPPPPPSDSPQPDVIQALEELEAAEEAAAVRMDVHSPMRGRPLPPPPRPERRNKSPWRVQEEFQEEEREEEIEQPKLEVEEEEERVVLEEEIARQEVEIEEEVMIRREAVQPTGLFAPLPPRTAGDEEALEGDEEALAREEEKWRQEEEEEKWRQEEEEKWRQEEEEKWRQEEEEKWRQEEEEIRLEAGQVEISPEEQEEELPPAPPPRRHSSVKEEVLSALPAEEAGEEGIMEEEAPRPPPRRYSEQGPEKQEWLEKWEDEKEEKATKKDEDFVGPTIVTEEVSIATQTDPLPEEEVLLDEDEEWSLRSLDPMAPVAPTVTTSTGVVSLPTSISHGQTTLRDSTVAVMGTHLNQLEVDSLSVGELRADRLIVSEVEGVTLHVSEVTAETGNLTTTTIGAGMLSADRMQVVQARLEEVEYPSTSAHPRPVTPPPVPIVQSPPPSITLEVSPELQKLQEEAAGALLQSQTQLASQMQALVQILSQMRSLAEDTWRAQQVQRETPSQVPVARKTVQADTMSDSHLSEQPPQEEPLIQIESPDVEASPSSESLEADREVTEEISTEKGGEEGEEEFLHDSSDRNVDPRHEEIEDLVVSSVDTPSIQITPPTVVQPRVEAVIQQPQIPARQIPAITTPPPTPITITTATTTSLRSAVDDLAQPHAVSEWRIRRVLEEGEEESIVDLSARLGLACVRGGVRLSSRVGHEVMLSLRHEDARINLQLALCVALLLLACLLLLAGPVHVHSHHWDMYYPK